MLPCRVTVTFTVAAEPTMDAGRIVGEVGVTAEVTVTAMVLVLRMY
jgi:hypothetical protein